jgi:hypothetical protein
VFFSNFYIDFILLTISPGSGKRPVSDREKTFFPSTMTSKIPLEPSMSMARIPGALFNSAARPAARNSNPQGAQ